MSELRKSNKVFSVVLLPTYKKFSKKVIFLAASTKNKRLFLFLPGLRMQNVLFFLQNAIAHPQKDTNKAKTAPV